MNKFDVSFISTLDVNDLTLEEVNNLKTQKNEIDKILKSYEEKQNKLCIERNRNYIGKYFKKQHELYIDYYKVLSINPFDFLTFTLDKNGGFNIYRDMNEFTFNDDFFNFDVSYNDDLFSFNDMIEIDEEEFKAAMDKKYQEFKKELNDNPYIIGIKNILTKIKSIIL